METEREKQEEGLALRIKHWVTAHYHRHQPADAVRTLVELLRLGHEEEEGMAEGWRPTIEQLFWWTFVSQGPHAALAFLDGAEVVTEAPAPAVFVVAASCLVGHDSMLGAAAARMPENFWKRKLVLSRASRALELASDPAAAAASSTAMMAKVAVLLLRGGDLLLEALQWHSVGIEVVHDEVEQLVEVLFSLRGQQVCDPDMVLAGLQLCKYMPKRDLYQQVVLEEMQALLQHPEESIRHATANLNFTQLLSSSGGDALKACLPFSSALTEQYSQERSARVREAIICALLNHFGRGQEGALELLLLGIQDEDASVALMAVDGLSSWVEEPVWRRPVTHCLPQLVDVLVKHIALPDVKSLVALCVDCVVVHHRQQQVSSSIAVLPVELQELITKELTRKPGPVKTAGQQHVPSTMQVPDSDEPISEQLRKASANLLDILSQCFEDLAVEVLRVVPAMVRSDSPWQLRESGVFLMGIVAESMYKLWEPSSIKQLLRHFNAAAIPSLAVPQPKLREIACWTVSRFARSVLNTDEARRGSDIDGRAVVDSLLEIMRTDPKVHAAVMTALANLVEQGLFRQMPEQGRALLENIITLGRNPSGPLLDLISTCFESPDFTSIVDVELEQLLVPLLLDAVERATLDLDLSNKSTVEYLDIALSAVANLVPSMKDRFKPFVERVAGQIERVRAHQATGAGEAENQRQLAGACTDLCSRLFEEGCDLSRFISPARLVAIADLTSQEGFALLGELAKLGPDPLKDSLPHIEATLAALFAERRHCRGGDPVLHNAEWAAGQLARHMATGLQLLWVNNFLTLCRSFGTHNRAATLLQLGLHHAHVLPASLVRDALLACLHCFTPDQEPWEQSRAVIVAGLPNLVRCLAPAGLGQRLSEAQARALLVFFVRQIDWLCCHAPDASPSDAGGTVSDEGDRVLREPDRNTDDDDVYVDEQRVCDALNALASAEQVGAWIDEAYAADDNERGRWRAIVEHYVVGAGGRHYTPLLLALRRSK